MLRPFTNRDLFPISEAYLRMICESKEDKNRKRAVKFADQWLSEHNMLGQVKTKTAGGREIYDGEAIEHETALSVENARKMADAKYMLGAVRLYIELQMDSSTRNDAGADLGRLNQIIKIIASDPNHLQEYNDNLNGLSFKELDRKFATSVRTQLKKDMEDVSSRTYTKKGDYEFVRIPDFDTASQYSNYTSWCVTHGKSAWDSYTHGGTGIFYFCLEKGFENVPKQEGEGCPLDAYGKSMIAISVNDDGSLNTCTCRWNHDNGGSDQLMTTQEISDFFGVNFYETFKPRPVEEILVKYKELRVRDDKICRMLDCIKIYDGNGKILYVKVVNGRIEKMMEVGKNLLFKLSNNEFIKIGDGPFEIKEKAFYNSDVSGEVEIPYGVTSIGYEAFYHCRGLTSVTIPNSVTSIERGAFINCSNLKDVTIPDSVTSIRNSAFAWCSGLTSVTIGNSVTSIGEMAFYNCKGLTSVKIPDSVTSIGMGAFGYCEKLTSVTIPDSVRSIGREAFATCSRLTNVVIGDSVTSIGEKAFYWCRNLTSVTIPDSVTSIGGYAFFYCTNLMRVRIGNSVMSIGNYAFTGCSALTSMTIPKIFLYKLKDIGIDDPSICRFY